MCKNVEKSREVYPKLCCKQYAKMLSVYVCFVVVCVVRSELVKNAVMWVRDKCRNFTLHFCVSRDIKSLHIDFPVSKCEAVICLHGNTF